MLNKMFNKQWFKSHQKLILLFANTFIGRWILCINGQKSSVGKNKIIGIIPNTIFWAGEKENQYVAEFRTHDKFSKRIFYAFLPIWKLAHAWDMLFANPFVPRWNLGFDTLTAYPVAGANSPVDGAIGRVGVDQTFANILSGAGNASQTTSTTDSLDVTASTTTNQFARNKRMIFTFDTSLLTTAATISLTVLSLYVTSKSQGLGSNGFSLVVVGATPAATNTLADADYAQLGITLFDFKNYPDVTTSAYNDFTFNATGIATINKTGISKLGVVNGWDYNNGFTGGWSSGLASSYEIEFADNAGNKPKLVVTFTLPGGTLDLTSKMW